MMELVRKRYTLKYIHVRMHSTFTTMGLVRNTGMFLDDTLKILHKKIKKGVHLYTSMLTRM